MLSNQMPDARHDVSMDPSASDFIEKSMRDFEISKFEERDFKDYEIEYLNGCDPMAIKRLTESCRI